MGRDWPVMVMAFLSASTARLYDSCALGNCWPLLPGTETSPITSLITLFFCGVEVTVIPSLSVLKWKKILHMFRKNYLSCLKQLSHQSQKVAFWQQASSGRRSTFTPVLPLFRISYSFLKCYEPLRKLFSPFHPACCHFSKPRPSFAPMGLL